MSEEMTTSQRFESDTSQVERGVSDAYRAGKTAKRLHDASKAGGVAEAGGKFAGKLFKKGAESATSTALSIIFLKIKLIIYAILAVGLLIFMVSLGFSSAAINETVHLNNAETIATNKYDFNYEGEISDDKALILETVEDCKTAINEVINDAVENAIVKASAQIELEKLAYAGADDEVIFITTANREYESPVSDEHCLYVLSAFSVSKQNLMSEDASDAYNDLTLDDVAEGAGMVHEMKEQLAALISEPPVVEAYGNALIEFSLEKTESSFTVLEDDGEYHYTLVHFTVTYHDVDYFSAVQDAFGIDMMSPYSDAAPDVTVGQYVYELCTSTGEIAGIAFSDGFGATLSFSRALFTGIANHDIVAVAESQAGHFYSKSNPYTQWYTGGYGQYEWCAMFVSWCASQCGFIEQGIIPKFSCCSTGSDSGTNWFYSHDQLTVTRGTTSYIPKEGDIVFVDTKTFNGSQATHVGIVRGASPDGTMIYTVEGNTHAPSGADARKSGTGVYLKSREASQIYGYGIPRYELVNQATGNESGEVIEQYAK